jgi:hypothetical protein
VEVYRRGAQHFGLRSMQIHFFDNRALVTERDSEFECMRGISASIGQAPRSTETATRIRSTLEISPGSSSFVRSETMSEGSGPASAFSNSRQSSTVRAIGPQ